MGPVTGWVKLRFMEQWEDQKLMPYQSGRDGTDLERVQSEGRAAVNPPLSCSDAHLGEGGILQRCHLWGRRNPAAMLTLGKQGSCGDAHLGEAGILR